jgi:hypothetical protein
MDETGLSLLKTEMQCEEIHIKVNAIHRMRTVITSIGPSETQVSLVPYLKGKSNHFLLEPVINLNFKSRADRN